MEEIDWEAVQELEEEYIQIMKAVDETNTRTGRLKADEIEKRMITVFGDVPLT